MSRRKPIRWKAWEAKYGKRNRRQLVSIHQAVLELMAADLKPATYSIILASKVGRESDHVTRRTRDYTGFKSEVLSPRSTIKTKTSKFPPHSFLLKIKSSATASHLQITGTIFASNGPT